MKKSMTTPANKNQISNFLKRCSLIILALLLFQFNSMQAANDESSILTIEKPSTAPILDPFFADIINKIKIGHFYNATVTTLNEKTKGATVDVFSSYGFTQEVNKLNDRILELKNLSTSFSDRALFSGSKTVEKITITESGSKVNVEVTFITWSNSKVVLNDVKLRRINKVTFITGYVIDGNNASFYTIALKDMGEII